MTDSIRRVFRWDLDKTYLRTEFDTLRDLVRAVFERATDKRAVPGAPALLRALRSAGGPGHWIGVVSGSPRQMRGVLEAKLALDGVELDEFVLKPNLRNVLRGRLRALRQQIPYKLPALLESRISLGGQAPEILFGDDAESDAIVYSLYADVVAGAVDREGLDRVLERVAAYPDDRRRILELADRIPRGDVVRRILIHLDRRSPTARFERYGPRLVPIYNYFQAALLLYAEGILGASHVVWVAHEMMVSEEYDLAALANSLQDLMRRGRLDRHLAARLATESESATDELRQKWPGLPPREEIAWAFATRVRALGAVTVARPAEAARIDYVKLLDEDAAARRRAPADR